MNVLDKLETAMDIPSCINVARVFRGKHINNLLSFAQTGCFFIFFILLKKLKP
jgi:hypothetical protein